MSVELPPQLKKGLDMLRIPLSLLVLNFTRVYSSTRDERVTAIIRRRTSHPRGVILRMFALSGLWVCGSVCIRAVFLCVGGGMIDLS